VLLFDIPMEFTSEQEESINNLITLVFLVRDNYLVDLIRASDKVGRSIKCFIVYILTRCQNSLSWRGT